MVLVENKDFVSRGFRNVKSAFLAVELGSEAHQKTI